jgi:hypothetical protein
MDDFIHGRHTGRRATGSIDDLIHGRQGALWMTSSMDATEGGKQKILQIVLVQLELEPAGTCNDANGKFRY